MKFEQDLVGNATAPTLEGATRRPSADARRDIRVLSDALIQTAIQANELPPLIGTSCDLMLGLARALIAHGLTPHTGHFIAAATQLVEAARGVYDRGMMVDDADRALEGAVMIELTVRGICAALSIDYEAHMRARVSPQQENSDAIH